MAHILSGSIINGSLRSLRVEDAPGVGLLPVADAVPESPDDAGESPNVGIVHENVAVPVLPAEAEVDGSGEDVEDAPPDGADEGLVLVAAGQVSETVLERRRLLRGAMQEQDTSFQASRVARKSKRGDAWVEHIKQHPKRDPVKKPRASSDTLEVNKVVERVIQQQTSAASSG